MLFKKTMALSKHLVYVDFDSFNRHSGNSYLKDTCEFVPTLSWLQIHVIYTLPQNNCQRH